MTLLAPLLLAGLVGLALPLIAHLRGREEPRTIVFAARRFLEGGDEILSQRRTLRERLLLALRLLLLALVALALARPVSRHEADLAVLGEAHDAVLLIDGSRSMGLRIDDQSLFAATGEAAAALAAALPRPAPGSASSAPTRRSRGSSSAPIPRRRSPPSASASPPAIPGPGAGASAIACRPRSPSSPTRGARGSSTRSAIAARAASRRCRPASARSR
ncbi:MAG: BatA domain-containing protein [Myxococcales bacterium]|nr:BatA domain-containing protein [Myxococcales bacterium]